VESYCTCFSWSKLSGNFDPGGNKGFSFGLSSFTEFESVTFGVFFDEFPAFPDLTMFRRGGMLGAKKYAQP
jgi:hypothetical protein